MEPASIWQILASSVASVLVGMIWYHPRAFGATWMNLAHITPEMTERSRRRMPIYALIGFIASMLIAWMMSSVGVALGIYDWVGAIFELALPVWLGFVVPTMLSAVLWEHRPLKLYFINIAYWFVSFSVIALILLY
jgi:hypothetical protein